VSIYLSISLSIDLYVSIYSLIENQRIERVELGPLLSGIRHVTQLGKDEGLLDLDGGEHLALKLRFAKESVPIKQRSTVLTLDNTLQVARPPHKGAC